LTFKITSWNLGVHWDFNSQSGNPFRSVWAHSLTLSYTPGSVWMWLLGCTLAYIFPRPCLGHEPRLRSWQLCNFATYVKRHVQLGFWLYLAAYSHIGMGLSGVLQLINTNIKWCANACDWMATKKQLRCCFFITITWNRFPLLDIFLQLFIGQNVGVH
jgi:hypothetical protein